MSRKLIIGAAGAVLLFGSTPLFALGEGSADKVNSLVERTAQTAESGTKAVTDEVRSTAEAADEKVKSQKEQIEGRKAELREKIEARAAERKERLEGRRLAQCQNRQADINQLMGKSAELGREKLGRIQGYEQAIKDFYVKQQLSIETYEAATLAVDAKEAEAIAALDTMDAWQYDCDEIDAKRPTQDIQSNREAKRNGLKAYRDSVKELLTVVREAFTQKQQEAGDAQQ